MIFLYNLELIWNVYDILWIARHLLEVVVARGFILVLLSNCLGCARAGAAGNRALESIVGVVRGILRGRGSWLVLWIGSICQGMALVIEPLLLFLLSTFLILLSVHPVLPRQLRILSQLHSYNEQEFSCHLLHYHIVSISC